MTCESYGSAARATVVAGAVGTGKTQELVGRIAEALRSGADGADMLVFAASAPAAERLACRIAEAAGAAAECVRVTTPVAYARELLGTPGAAAALAGRTHMLADFEASFFLEDMKVTGVKQHRLKEILKFLQRGWSEMRDDEEGWLVTGEEMVLSKFARRRLAFTGALLPCEVTAAAVRYLEGDAAALATASRALVFADDYRVMSRASQRLVRLVAGRAVTVAWNGLGGIAGEETYGYADGLAEFEADMAVAGAELERVDLATSSQAAEPYGTVANLYKQVCMEGDVAPELDPMRPQGSFAVACAPDLADEMAQVAGLVKAALDEGCAPNEVFCAVPTPAWAARVASALQREGIAASVAKGRQALGGDIRDLGKSAAAAAFTALHLAADPASAVAWRCWCGFGDYLACSTGVDALIKVADAQGSADQLPALLGRLADGEDLGVAVDRDRLRARVALGRELIADADALRGEELLDRCAGALGAAGEERDQVLAALRGLLGEVDAGESAAELYARAERNLVAPVFAADCVRVGCFDSLLGQDPRALVLCGCVNGLLPRLEYFDLSMATIDAQEKMHVRLIQTLIAVCGKARETLVCSTFERAGIVESETLKLKTERVRLRDGRRVCDLAPSVAVEYLRGQKLALQR